MALRGVIFDTDGVITQTATVHFAAWKRVFDDVLRRAGGNGFEPFTEADYRRHVDGMDRYDGVATFLSSRGIELTRGAPSDPAGHDTVCAIGNLKNDAFLATLRDEGVVAYPGTVRLVEALRAAGVSTAAVSASRNCGAVLEAAGVAGLFDARVDGLDAAELHLAGKPQPDLFLEAARRLGLDPQHAAVVEDAIAGVDAARRGGFGLVVGVDRSGHPEELQPFADVVVADLADLEWSGVTLVASVRRTDQDR